MEVYLETLEKLSFVLENCNKDSPTIIVGDLNTRLPRSGSLNENWYRDKPFSRRSAILYDFICDNQMAVANFCFNQPVNHTYSKGKKYIIYRSYSDTIIYN